MIRKEMVLYSLSDSGWEVTHRFPNPFVNDTCTFIFKYTAPNTPGYDTIYANGNSVNLDSIPDTLDAWNFAANKPIRIYVPIGHRKYKLCRVFVFSFTELSKSV